MKTNLQWLWIAVTIVGLAGSAVAQPVVKEATTTLYATVPDPMEMSFSSDGALFVGRDASGSGGSSSEAVKIHRVAPGGSPVTEFGDLAISDPDALIVDVKGAVSGTPDCVLVGGVHTNGSTGKIVKILPNGAVTPWIGPDTSVLNPGGFTFDDTGRLLIADMGNGKVLATTGETPSPLLSFAFAQNVAVDSLNRIVVGSAGDPWLRLYTSDGELSSSNLALVKLSSPLARGPGSAWGTDVYAISPNGALMRISPSGTSSQVGTGFASVTSMCFGPDGALYAGVFAADCIWRIAPVSLAPTLIVTRTNTNLTLTWMSRTNQAYQLESAPDLPAVTWLEEGPVIYGTGGWLSANYPLGAEPRRFFRLRLDD
jgi:hypothetical protein